MMEQPVYWSLRRELWENRSIYMAPLIVAAVAVFGFLVSTVTLPRKMRGLPALDPEKQLAVVATPYGMVASMILMAGVLASFFYSLDALTSERRDRSILFWKSLPVSDAATVLTKASIPMAVQPLIGFVLAYAAQLLMLLFSTTVLTVSGVGAAAVWSRLPLLEMPLVMLYGLIAHALWHAPMYCWLLLVSAWARRAAILWAVLPFAAAYVLERFTLGTKLVGSMLRYRFMGAMSEAFSVDVAHAPILRLSQLRPLNFLSSSGLWLGLILAALFLALTVRLRRYREPN